MDSGNALLGTFWFLAVMVVTFLGLTTLGGAIAGIAKWDFKEALGPVFIASGLLALLAGVLAARTAIRKSKKQV